MIDLFINLFGKRRDKKKRTKMAGTTTSKFDDSFRFLIEKFGLKEQFDQATGKTITSTAQAQNLASDSGTKNNTRTSDSWIAKEVQSTRDSSSFVEKVEQKTLESRSYIAVAVQNTLTSSSWILRPTDLLRIRNGSGLGTNEFGSMTGETIARDLKSVMNDVVSMTGLF